MHGATNLRDSEGTVIMFKILEFKGVSPAQATEVGRRYATREEAQAAVKMHLKTFKVSGRNPEGGYGGPGMPKASENARFPAPTEGRRRC
jgi:hypothetical protein